MILFVVVAVLLGLAGLTLFLVALEIGAAGFALGLLLALLPLPVYLALALWIDRYEKEPLGMLALAFLWGASGALFFSFVLNSFLGAVFLLTAGEGAARVGGAVLGAPVVEESAKGAALFLLYLWKHDEFDNVTDGIVYAAMVGLGFATIENVLYYGKALAEGMHGPAFFLRGVVSPYAHPLFTAMTGIGLGLARESRGGAAKWAAPAAGLLLAILIHAAWNLSATLGAVFFLAYFFVMVPLFLGVLALVAWSLGRERAILRAHLAPYAARGVITRGEIERLTTPRARLADRMAAFGAEGRAGWRRTGAFQRAAGELAFHRWRRSRAIGRGPAADAAREREALARLRAARRGPAPGERPPVVPPPDR